MYLKSILLGAIALGVMGCNSDAPKTEDERTERTAKSDRYQAEGWTAKTLPEIADAIASGEVSSVEITQAYLDRIHRLDRDGPKLRSVISVNTDAIALAKAADAKRASGEALGPLHGVPILIKDNIETKDGMATTAGSLALSDNVTGRDSPLIDGLRAAGAIILGKTNLSQWANYRSESSMSGWSSIGGQVRNPHILDRNPCGSSSGSGVAVAASLAAGAVGTETNGSVICPSNVNGIVGFKPTVGLVSQQYIVPISSSQDTAGPMTKSVRGAAMMLDAMATGDDAVNFAQALNANSLRGLRVGVLRYSLNSNQNITQLFDDALVNIENAGAELVEISQGPTLPSEFWTMSRLVLDVEFKAGINDYLASAAPDVPARSLSELISFNQTHAEQELSAFDQSIFLASMQAVGVDDPSYIEARDVIQNATRKDGIDALLEEHGVDVLVFPSGVFAPSVDAINGDVWPEWVGAGSLAAIAGYPHASVPMGTFRGLPVGISFVGTANNDAAILSYAYAYEQASNNIHPPQYLKSASKAPEIEAFQNGVRK